MAALERIEAGARVAGLTASGVVDVVAVTWHGSDTVEVMYRDSSGSVDVRLLSRGDESRLDVFTHEQPWSVGNYDDSLQPKAEGLSNTTNEYLKRLEGHGAALPVCNVVDEGDRTAVTRSLLMWEGTWREYLHDSHQCSHYEAEMDPAELTALTQAVASETYDRPSGVFAEHFVDTDVDGEPIARILIPRRSETATRDAIDQHVRKGLAVTHMFSGDRDFW